jgi:hypothetical protein
LKPACEEATDPKRRAAAAMRAARVFIVLSPSRGVCLLRAPRVVQWSEV